MAVSYRYRPPPPLEAFVDVFWLYEDNTALHAKERRLPDGSMTLVINLRDDLVRTYDQRCPDRARTNPGCVISGAQSTFALLDTACLTSVMGVQFKPGGAAPFLPLPAGELHNEVISLELVWGAKALHLRERLLAAATPTLRFHILQQSLLARLAPSWVEHPAVAFALQQFHQNVSARPAIRALTEQVGMSHTRFTHIFRDAVGLTPKHYTRVLRFQRVLGAVERGLPVRWGELALSCGYFDQSHLIHDFRAFSGMTPQAYLAARGENRNHIALAV